MPQAQVGKTKSVPKVVRVNAADGEAILYRNLGNGRRVPFIWGTTVTLASGTTEIVVSSGVSFSDHDVSEAIMSILPLSVSGAGLTYYINKNTTTNVVTLVSTAAPGIDCTFDVLFMLGVGYDFESTHTNQIWG